MMYMAQYTTAEFRANMRAVLDAVEHTHERATLTRQGRARFVVLSADDLSALEETLDILQTPELLADLQAAAQDKAAGRTHSLDEVRRELFQQ